MTITARIQFKPDETAHEFQFHTQGSDNPWRFVSDKCAVKLVPVCDPDARPVKEPPDCDRVEIIPVRWGYPEFLLTDHADEVEQMRQEHFAGKHDFINGNLTWETWLQKIGWGRLWDKYRTPALEREWLDPCHGEGFQLGLYSGRQSGFKTVSKNDLARVQYRAEFHAGPKCQTIFLSKCVQSPLTTEERKLSPARIAKEEARLFKQAELEAATTKNIAAKKKLVTAESKLEAKRRQRQEEDVRQKRQRVAKATKAPPWQLDGFKVIYRRKANGKTLDEHTPTDTFRALCQILSEQPAQRARFGKIESLLGDRVRKLETEDGRGKAELSWAGRKQLREILKRKEAIKLTKWGILKVEEKTSRQKFLILSPPKPAK